MMNKILHLKIFAKKSDPIFRSMVALGLTFFLVGLQPMYSGNAYAQGAINISGTVKDDTGEGLPGANVLVKGSTRGIVTDTNGKYQIKANKGEVLVFSFAGMESVELTVGESDQMNATLNGITKLLEVVVTGYADVLKRSFTGASQSVNLEDVQIKGMGDATQMLQGRAAGVSIQNVSGTFGAGPKITIRGSSTIFGDGKPLWVIDGVVQEDIINLSLNDLVSGNANTMLGSSIAGLNPNDIESFDILKDASATSLYGTRSLNGVIVIKTKRGKANTPLSVNYSGEFTTRVIPGYSSTDILDSKETINILGEMRSKGLLDLTTLDQSRYSGVYGILARQINSYNTSSGEFGAANTVEAQNQFLRKYELANTNWFNELFQPTVTQNHTVSFSGGSEKNQFFNSVGFYVDPGWTIADKVNRISLNSRNSFNLGKSSQLTLSLLGSYRSQLAPGSFASKNDNVNGTITRDFDINPFSYVLNTSRALRPRDENGNLEYYTNNYAPFNILNEIRNNFIDLRVQDIKFQVDFQRPFLQKKLNYNFVGAIRYAGTTTEHIINEESNVVGAYRAEGNTIIRNANSFLFTDFENLNRAPRSVLPSGGIYDRSDNFLVNFYFRNSISFKHKINEIHETDALLGQETRFVNRDQVSFTGYGLQYARGYTVNTDPNIIKKLVQESNSYFDVSLNRERSVSVFSRFNYGYAGKYFITLTGNLNASNQQGLKDGNIQWTPTYSVSGKWNAKDEVFFSSINSLTQLSIRASYGLSAVAGIASNTYPVFFNRVTDRPSVSDRENAIRISSLQNNNLTWEKLYETNLGIDLGLLKNSVNLTADVYSREGFDLFDNVITSGIGGESVKLINNATMTTRGFELSLRTINLTLQDFVWSSTLNFSAFEQKITALQARTSVLNAIQASGASFLGQSRRSLYSLELTGLSSQGIPQYNIPNEDKSFGVNFQDTGARLEGGIASYLKYEGAVDPNQTISLQNNFSYKNWSLGIFVIASGGNAIRLPSIFSPNTYNDYGVFTRQFLNRWLVPGDENKTIFPVITDSRLNEENSRINIAYNAYNFSTARVASGDYVRVRSISLSYKLPSTLLSKLKLTNCTLSAIASNPFLIYADSRLNGVDPEFYNTGGVAQPIARQYTVSLNIGF